MDGDIEAADMAYRPFPPFAEWPRLEEPSARWDYSKALVKERGELTPQVLKAAREVAMRAAAIDTGAIEDLYQLDRGFTITVASQAAAWETMFAKESAKTQSLIESQLAAYDSVIDFATQRVPVAEAWIRELHRQICQAQGTYTGHTEQGPQQQELPLGAYKIKPNHVQLPDGARHYYAPVEETSPEMARLCEELRSDAFAKAHPVCQASYAHYGLVAIHPFADGNGRVARALASVYLYRTGSIPFLVLMEHRQTYFDALMMADRGEYQPLMDFFLDRSVDAFVLVSDTMRTAAKPSPEVSLSKISKLHYTRGGYLHSEVDYAGNVLIQEFYNEAARQAAEYKQAGLIEVSVSFIDKEIPDPPEGYRRPINRSPGMCQIHIKSMAPAQAEVGRRYYFEVPKDCDKDDLVRLRWRDGDHELMAAMKDLHPRVTSVLGMRLTSFVQLMFGEMFDEMVPMSEESLRAAGY